MYTQRSLTPYYFVVAGVILQGLSPVLTKLLLMDGLSRESVVTARYLLAVALMIPFGIPHKRREGPTAPPRPQDWLGLFLVGALGSGVGALLFTAALEYSSAGVVNSISKTAPIFVAFLGYLTLSERVSSVRLLLVGAMVGADALIGLGELSFGGPEARMRLLGDGLALLAGITRATAEILAKGALNRFSPSTVTLWRFGGGVLVTGAVSLSNGSWPDLLELGSRGIFLLLLLGGVSTALSMYLYYRGTAEIPVHVAVSLKILGAVVTAVVSWVVLRETLNLYHVAGMGVLISGGYLLVIRTARETPAAAGEPQEPAPAAPQEPATRGQLRARLTWIIASIIVATLLASTLLSIRHTNNVVRQQTRLTMGKVASVLVQLTSLEDPVSRNSLQQFIDRVVRHRLRDELFSVDIVYIVVADENDNVLAFAVNEDITLVTRDGRPYRPTDPRAAQQLVAMSRAGQLGRRQDLIPVRATLRGNGYDAERSPYVEIGCKRSIANRVLAEIAIRNLVLVMVLVALGIAVASGWVRRMTHPLERLAVSMQRLSGGELDLPLFSEGRGELREMGDSLQDLREALRLGGALRRSLVNYASTQLGAAVPGCESAGGPSETREAVLLFLRPPDPAPGEPGPDIPALVDRVVTTALRNDGEILGQADGQVVVAWSGGGEEDALWAVATALRLAHPDPSGRHSAPTVMLCAQSISCGAPGLDLMRIAGELPAVPEPGAVYADRGFIGLAGGLVEAAETDAPAVWRIVGLPEDAGDFAGIAGAGEG